MTRKNVDFCETCRSYQPAGGSGRFLCGCRDSIYYGENSRPVEFCKYRKSDGEQHLVEEKEN